MNQSIEKGDAARAAPPEFKPAPLVSMMNSLPEEHRRLLEAAQEQALAEFDELLEVPVGVPRETITRRLLEDRTLLKEVQERFERGKSSGKYPILSRYVSDLPDDAKEVFFAIGWVRFTAPPASPEKPWDYGPYNGDEESYREDLYNGLAFATADLRRFSKEWLEELARVGYRGVGGGSSGLPLKQRVDDSAISEPASLPPSGKAYPVRFENVRQVLWLQLDSTRSSKRGYREVRIADKPVRTDEAILAALTAMEGRPMDMRRLRKALAELKLPLERTMNEQWHEAFEGFPSEQVLEGKRPELVENLQHHQSLDYVLLLLRYHRTDFDKLPQGEKLALIERTCEYINEFLEALRKLAMFLEFGSPDRILKVAARTADKDVRATVLRDVDGLTYREIGEELGESLPDKYSIKTDHPKVRQMVRRGRSLLERTLGEEGWQRQIQAMKDEAGRWLSLNDAEQHAEDLVESLGIPYAEALRLAEEEEAYFEERRRSEKDLEDD